MSMKFGTAASLVELHITAEARLMPCSSTTIAVGGAVIVKCVSPTGCTGILELLSGNVVQVYNYMALILCAGCSLTDVLWH